MATDAPPPLEGIDPRISDSVGRRGIRVYTEIQRLALPVLETEEDALLLSPTGTGKTEAALLPLLSQRLADPLSADLDPLRHPDCARSIATSSTGSWPS